MTNHRIVVALSGWRAFTDFSDEDRLNLEMGALPQVIALQCNGNITQLG